MGHDFDEFMREIETDTRRGGSRAIAEAQAFEAQLDLALQLIQRRQLLGLTQRQLATKSGVQQSEISRIEGAVGNPTLQTIAVIARALGVRVQLAKPHGGEGASGGKAVRAP